jgi:hypothetical protein
MSNYRKYIYDRYVSGLQKVKAGASDYCPLRDQRKPDFNNPMQRRLEFGPYQLAYG